MATATQPRREEISFPPNTPVTVSLSYGIPKMVSGRGGERALFSLHEPANHVMFLDPPVAGQIATLGINVKEPFTITRCESSRKGEPASWRVERIAAAPAPGEQANGTFVVPRDPEAPPAPKPTARAEHATASLVEYASGLIDAYAAVLEHALTTHQGRVKPDEVRAVFLTCVINRQKGAA